MAQYFYSEAGRENGPFSLDELSGLIRRGVVPLVAVARRAESKDWQVIAAFPEFRSLNASGGNGLVKSQKSRGIYILLALFFVGLLGAHNFYAGRYKQAVAQLLVSVLTLGFGIPIVAVWVIVECVTITEDGAGDPMS